MVGFSQFNVYQREHFAIRIQGHDHNHCSEDEESTVSKIQSSSSNFNLMTRCWFEHLL